MVTPLFILGPCSAESREQIIETAEAISNQLSVFRCPFIFRAGVWKPRTRPDTFQGAGTLALEWLKEVKERFSVPVATEVATPEHVEAALQAGMDYLWIGARTSANPIAVEEIAKAVSHQLPAINNLNAEGSRLKAILIKNPVNADAALWLGNITRLEQTGVPVMAVHRGCNHRPCWSMAHAVRTERPDIPMLLDPSHMSGDAAQVPGLLDKIEELGLDGAMIEVHNNPAAALSDARQQISPADLTAVLTADKLPTEKDRYTEKLELNWLRAEIDELDERLWETVAARMDVSRRIGEWKKAHGVTPLQPERFRQIVERVQKTAEEKGLSAPFAEKVWELIHEESLKAQR